VRPGFTRETHTSRGKAVGNSAGAAGIVTGVRRLGQGPERSASRATTDTMASDRGDVVRQAMDCLSLEQTTSTPMHHNSFEITTVPIRPSDCHTPSEDFLRKNGWRVDVERHVLICLQCKSIMNPARVREHVMEFHREVKPDRRLQAQFKAVCGLQYDMLTSHPAHPLHPVPVVCGLKLQEYTQICSVCKRGFGGDRDRDVSHESKSFKKHICKKGEEAVERGFSVVPAQRFGQNFSWFAVILDEKIPSAPRNVWQEYQSRRASRRSSGTAASIPDDYRVLNQFLRKERWLEHVKGLDASVAIELCSCSSKDAVFGSLPRRVHAFLAKYQGRSSSYFLRRLIGIRPGVEHGQNYPRHHRAVDYNAHDKYSRRVAGALALLMRNVIDPNPNYRFVVAPKIAQVVRQLYAKLQASPDGAEYQNQDDEEGGNREELDSDDEDHYPHGEALPTVSPDVALDGDDVWPAGSDLAAEHTVDAVEDLYPYGMSETREVPKFEDATQECVMELLQLLYGQNLNDGVDDPFRSVFIRYIVLSSMRQSGQWRLASVITQVIAAILFAGRLMVAKIMLELKSAMPGVALSV
jgi:hypothetical protein